VRDLLWRIEQGEGEENFISMLRDMTRYMSYAYCAFAPGAAAPLQGLLLYFEEEIREHISQAGCPFKNEV
jgi:NADH-quinone oxidoreductase subunit F